MATDLMRAADALLQYQGTSLEVFLLDHADAGTGAPRVARELWQKTDGIIDVSHETIRRWTNQLRNGEPKGDREPAA